MQALLTQDSLLNNESNVSKEFRQAELMYLKSYALWLTLREKEMLSKTKRSA